MIVRQNQYVYDARFSVISNTFGFFQIGLYSQGNVMFALRADRGMPRRTSPTNRRLCRPSQHRGICHRRDLHPQEQSVQPRAKLTIHNSGISKRRKNNILVCWHFEWFNHLCFQMVSSLLIVSYKTVSNIITNSTLMHHQIIPNIVLNIMAPQVATRSGWAEPDHV